MYMSGRCDLARRAVAGRWGPTTDTPREVQPPSPRASAFAITAADRRSLGGGVGVPPELESVGLAIRDRGTAQVTVAGRARPTGQIAARRIGGAQTLGLVKSRTEKYWAGAYCSPRGANYQTT